jgi:hypothetical protein
MSVSEERSVRNDSTDENEILQEWVDLDPSSSSSSSLSSDAEFPCDEDPRDDGRESDGCIKNPRRRRKKKEEEIRQNRERVWMENRCLIDESPAHSHVQRNLHLQQPQLSVFYVSQVSR